MRTSRSKYYYYEIECSAFRFGEKRGGSGSWMVFRRSSHGVFNICAESMRIGAYFSSIVD